MEKNDFKDLELLEIHARFVEKSSQCQLGYRFCVAILTIITLVIESVIVFISVKTENVFLAFIATSILATVFYFVWDNMATRQRDMQFDILCEFETELEEFKKARNQKLFSKLGTVHYPKDKPE